MFAEHFCSRLVKPVALPAQVRELLPVSTTRALMAALILYVWTRPTFHLVSYPVRDYGLMGWQLTGIYPLNWLVPLSAAVLLIAAWEGFPRVQTASLAALWLQCIGISILVPLGAVEGAGWPVLFLLVALISESRAALLALATELGLQRTLMSLGAAVVAAPVVLLLLMPYLYSNAATRREENPFFVALTQVLKKKPEPRQVARPTPPPSAALARTVPPAASPPARVYAPPGAPEPAAELGLSPAYRCLMQRYPNEESEAQNALREAAELNVPDDEFAALQRRAIREHVMRQLYGTAMSGWLSVDLPALRRSVWGTIQTYPIRTQDSRTPTNLAWVRPMVASAVAHYSVKAIEPDPNAGSPAPKLFPVDVSCDDVAAQRISQRAWVYPIAEAGAAQPPATVRNDDGTVLVQFPPASIERAASIVDFARFAGAQASVALAPALPDDDEPWADNPRRGRYDSTRPVWNVSVTTDLPVLLVRGNELVPGRLLRAHGGDRCIAPPGLEVLVAQGFDGPVTGLLLLSDESLARRISVVETKTRQRSGYDARVRDLQMRLDATGDAKPDFVFRIGRIDIVDRASSYQDTRDDRWIEGPWYESRAIRIEFADRDDAPAFDTVIHASCD